MRLMRIKFICLEREGFYPLKGYTFFILQKKKKKKKAYTFFENGMHRNSL